MPLLPLAGPITWKENDALGQLTLYTPDVAIVDEQNSRVVAPLSVAVAAAVAQSSNSI